MGKRNKKTDCITDFLNGKAFVKVETKSGFHSFVKKVLERESNGILDVPAEFIEDFEKHLFSPEYYLVFSPQQKRIKCANKEFFDFVYKTDNMFMMAQGKEYIFGV